MPEFDLQWLLIGLPVAFAFGWIGSRIDLRQWRREQRAQPASYFKGLNLLLNEQPDKAIDAFIEAVQHDPDTSELHFALGNLFRRRGEFERAVRVHEHLLSRADLSAGDRERAQHALAQDFMKAGLFDRAEQAFQTLAGGTHDTEARLALLQLHERARDWRAAADDAAQLERAGAGSFAARIAHHWCELALEADARGDAEQAEAALQRALAAAPTAPRPMMLQAERQRAAGASAAALDTYETLSQRRPDAFGLLALDYAQLAKAQPERVDGARRHLDALYGQLPSMALLRARLALDGDIDIPARLREHLRHAPSLSAAQALLAEAPGQWGDDGLSGIRQAVEQAVRPLQRYRCAACGFDAQRWFWQCPGCQTWDSYPARTVEEL
jgi:lipopolysaccharide biosynthesis regulator YciM